MADLPVPSPAPANPAPANPAPNQPADPTSADPNVPVPNQPALAAPHIIHQQVLNWSHFKPEFAGRTEEDTEAHHLFTNDWMLIYNFLDDEKIQIFCLT